MTRKELIAELKAEAHDKIGPAQDVLRRRSDALKKETDELAQEQKALSNRWHYVYSAIEALEYLEPKE